jgi:hypothetical protein
MIVKPFPMMQAFPGNYTGVHDHALSAKARHSNQGISAVLISPHFLMVRRNARLITSIDTHSSEPYHIAFRDTGNILRAPLMKSRPVGCATDGSTWTILQPARRIPVTQVNYLLAGKSLSR